MCSGLTVTAMGTTMESEGLTVHGANGEASEQRSRTSPGQAGEGGEHLGPLAQNPLSTPAPSYQRGVSASRGSNRCWEGHGRCTYLFARAVPANCSHITPCHLHCSEINTKRAVLSFGEIIKCYTELGKNNCMARRQQERLLHTRAGHTFTHACAHAHMEETHVNTGAQVPADVLASRVRHSCPRQSSGGRFFFNCWYHSWWCLGLRVIYPCAQRGNATPGMDHGVLA